MAICLLVLVSYGAAVFNGYALDDFIVLAKNKFVQQGFAGIASIFGNDTFAGLSDANTMVLTGGRYRPLSVVSFAMEYQLWGLAPAISHAINVLLYACSCCLLYRCLQYAWPFKAFTLSVTLLFAALPIHSEVIINIKGRDDIFCLLFFLSSILILLKNKNTLSSFVLLQAAVLYFLALLSKETAITFLAIYPFVFAFTMHIKKALINSCYMLIPVLLFLLIRQMAVGGNTGAISTDVFNNPFIHADRLQRLATVLLTWLLYLQKIVWPSNLAYDYSFNQIPITDFGNLWVWLSLFIHAGITVWAILQFKTQKWIAFAWLWYVATFSIVSNLLFNIGAPLADRFMYIPSLGIILLIVLCLNALFKNIKSVNEKLSVGITIMLLLPMIWHNYSRCANWKNNHALFLHDVFVVPQNAKAQLNAGLSYIEIAQQDTVKPQLPVIQKAIAHLQNGIKIYPQFIDGYLNMGVAYNTIGNIDSALWWWDKARTIDAYNSSLKTYDGIMAGYFLQKGLQAGTTQNFGVAVTNLKKSVALDSTNAEAWYNLGGANFSMGMYNDAVIAWQKTITINPGHAQAAAGLQAALQKVKQP
ncbi:MAG: DUF1736 domain-containing protein [Bacteroidia bacterium]|nr:DUF1736 domain-containing protein [Bacteroidia bacterium]HQV00215.1 tetratricopeptide repeat protein [Bacteroidia bacterium]